MRKIPFEKESEIIHLYTEALVRTPEIADRFGVNERSIRRLLARHGVRSDGRAIRICPTCRKTISTARCRARKTARSYCSKECYFAIMREVPFQKSVMGTRTARKVIRALGFDLLDEHVVHHEDKNQDNNAPKNLMVFASQGDHTRWHRCGGEASGVVPLFRGAGAVIVRTSHLPKKYRRSLAEQGLA